METDKKVILGFVFGSILIMGIILGLSFSSSGKSKDQITEFSENDENRPIITMAEKTFDFGNIKSQDEVIHEFKFENTGKSDLEITDITTSCMCTTARVVINGDQSQEFGMHSDSSWVGKVSPQQNGTIKIFFDADYHKGVTGAITRGITFKTNDPKNPEINLTIEADIV